MKPAAALLCLASISVNFAHAGENPPVLPPVEFDKPYTGMLVMSRPQTMEEVAKDCRNAKTSLGYMLACSFQWGSAMCRIVMAPNDEIIARGHKPEWVLQHEIGHCNGWPADHKGARRP